VKKLMIVVALGVPTLLASSLIANAAQPATAEAQIDPINGSGIHARIFFWTWAAKITCS